MLIMIPIENKKGLLCDHGCGQIAKFQNASGKLCCCESFYKCPGYRKKQSEDSKRRPPSIKKGTRLKDKSGICDICGNPHDGSYGSGRYCSSECAHKASTLHTDKEITNKKISETLRSRSKKEIQNSSSKALETYNMNHPDSKKKKQSKICKICGQVECLDKDICTHMKRLNLDHYTKIMDLSKLGSIEIYQEYEKLKRYLYDMYINKEKSSVDIANDIGINWVSVMFLLNKFQIHKRNRSESSLITLKNHPEKLFYSWNQYHSGYHTSWNGKTFWYRSSYELDYAKILDENQIEYEVESIRLEYWKTEKKRKGLMISDFYLPKLNIVVEVKSDFTYDEQDWKDRIKVLELNGYKPMLLLEHRWYDSKHVPSQRIQNNINCL